MSSIAEKYNKLWIRLINNAEFVKGEIELKENVINAFYNELITSINNSLKPLDNLEQKANDYKKYIENILAEKLPNNTIHINKLSNSFKALDSDNISTILIFLKEICVVLKEISPLFPTIEGFDYNTFLTHILNSLDNLIKEVESTDKITEAKIKEELLKLTNTLETEYPKHKEVVFLVKLMSFLLDKLYFESPKSNNLQFVTDLLNFINTFIEEQEITINTSLDQLLKLAKELINDKEFIELINLYNNDLETNRALVYTKTKAMLLKLSCQLKEVFPNNLQVVFIEQLVNYIFKILPLMFTEETTKDIDIEEILNITPKEIEHNIENHFSEITKLTNKLLLKDEDVKETTEIEPEEKIIIKEQSLKGIWDFSLELLKPFDENVFFDLNTALATIKEKAKKLEGILYIIFDDNDEVKDFIKEQIRPQAKQWLTIPEDFRPNNWVELIHVIVKNIRFSIKNTNNIPKPLKVFVDKLESILSTVDNDDYKLLVTSKEQPKIREVVLPDIFGISTTNTKAIEENQKELVTIYKNNEVKETTQNNNKVEQVKENIYNNETIKEEGKKGSELTIQSIIYSLCFGTEYGATTKLNEEDAEVIKELYHKEWLQKRLEMLENKFTIFFNEKKIKDIWEDFKILIFKEDGIALTEILNFVIDKFESIINKGIDWLKDLIFFVVDEIFNLIKAIIAFFKNVDIPPSIKTSLKELPPFKNLPDDVSILHILLAIPYTLYKEFMNYEIPNKEENLTTA